jgi:hypothetical protein
VRLARERAEREVLVERRGLVVDRIDDHRSNADQVGRGDGAVKRVAE